MEYYLRNLSLPYYHNCSARGRSFAEWTATGRSDVLTSIPLLVYGIVITFIYLVSITVFLQRDIRCKTIYRIMLWISLCDLNTSIVVSVVQPFFQIKGYVFCSYPHIIYFIGCFSEAAWAGSCIGCFFLVTSRLVDVLSKEWYYHLFRGKKALIYIGLCFLYWSIFYFFVYPVLFNSKMRTWLYNPLIFEDGRWDVEYSFAIVIFNNICLTTLTLVMYIIFVVFFIKKFHVTSSAQKHSKIMLFIQSSVICTNHVIVGFLYVIMNWIPPNPAVSEIAAVFYQLSGGSSAITYVVFNKTIRNRMLSNLHIRIKSSVKPTQLHIYNIAQHQNVPESTHHSSD